ncbi:hypothetical protein BH11PSE7_BH11PSE7_33930 [soil metagenome]
MAAILMADFDGAQAAKQKANEAPGHADAARYAILRRLAPALKHDMVVHLQAAAMMAEVIAARMDRGVPADDALQNNLSRLNRMARQAVAASLEVATWIEPAHDDAIELSAGVLECVAVVRSNFSFRGFEIVNDVVNESLPVSRTVLRNHLVAVMLCVTDDAQAPCVLTISHNCTETGALLTVRCSAPLAATDSQPVSVHYTPVRWPDVLAMALDDDVELTRSEIDTTLQISRMTVTRPLRITPV